MFSIPLTNFVEGAIEALKENPYYTCNRNGSNLEVTPLRTNYYACSGGCASDHLAYVNMSNIGLLKVPQYLKTESSPENYGYLDLSNNQIEETEDTIFSLVNYRANKVTNPKHPGMFVDNPLTFEAKLNLSELPQYHGIDIDQDEYDQHEKFIAQTYLSFDNDSYFLVAKRLDLEQIDLTRLSKDQIRYIIEEYSLIPRFDLKPYYDSAEEIYQFYRRKVIFNPLNIGDVPVEFRTKELIIESISLRSSWNHSWIENISTRIIKEVLNHFKDKLPLADIIPYSDLGQYRTEILDNIRLLPSAFESSQLRAFDYSFWDQVFKILVDLVKEKPELKDTLVHFLRFRGKRP